MWPMTICFCQTLAKTNEQIIACNLYISISINLVLTFCCEGLCNFSYRFMAERLVLCQQRKPFLYSVRKVKKSVLVFYMDRFSVCPLRIEYTNLQFIDFIMYCFYFLNILK